LAVEEKLPPNGSSDIENREDGGSFPPGASPFVSSASPVRAMLTGTHPFCSKTVTFLPSPSARPAFRRVNRREIAGLVVIAGLVADFLVPKGFLKFWKFLCFEVFVS
jgi:hypothetical protein